MNNKGSSQTKSASWIVSFGAIPMAHSLRTPASFLGDLLQGDQKAPTDSDSIKSARCSSREARIIMVPTFFFFVFVYFTRGTLRPGKGVSVYTRFVFSVVYFRGTQNPKKGWARGRAPRGTKDRAPEPGPRADLSCWLCRLRAVFDSVAAFSRSCCTSGAAANHILSADSNFRSHPQTGFPGPWNQTRLNQRTVYEHDVGHNQNPGIKMVLSPEPCFKN